MFASPKPPGGRGEPVQTDPDAAIRLTDTDAALARYSAVKKNYHSDPFIRHFLPRGAHLQPARPPLINVGTYVRSEAIDVLVNQWLALSQQEGKQCQIVSLGAGSDTRFWRISSGPMKERLAAYVEIDFAEVTTKKAMAIRSSKELSSLLGNPEDVTLASGGTELHAPVYHLVPADLRLPPAQSFGPRLAPSGTSPAILSPSLPTLLLFECVLVYMQPAASAAVIQWFVDHFSSTDDGVPLGSIVYEMFGLNDPFGKVMLNNLKARNVSLPGADPYPSIASLPNRFLQHGFTTSRAMTLRDIRRTCIASEELERISQLEMLDEIEELELVLNHYAITWGLKGVSGQTQAEWVQWGLNSVARSSSIDD